MAAWVLDRAVCCLSIELLEREGKREGVESDWTLGWWCHGRRASERYILACSTRQRASKTQESHPLVPFPYISTLSYDALLCLILILWLLTWSLLFWVLNMKLDQVLIEVMYWMNWWAANFCRLSAHFPGLCCMAG